MARLHVEEGKRALNAAHPGCVTQNVEKDVDGAAKPQFQNARQGRHTG